MNICMVTSRGEIVTYISSVVIQNLEHFLLKFMVLRYGTEYLWASDPLQVLIFLTQIEVVPFWILYLKVLSVFFYLYLFLALFWLFSSDLFIILIFFPMQMLSCIIFLCYFRRLYFYWARYLNALLVVYYLYLFLTYYLKCKFYFANFCYLRGL